MTVPAAVMARAAAGVDSTGRNYRTWKPIYQQAAKGKFLRSLCRLHAKAIHSSLPEEKRQAARDTQLRDAVGSARFALFIKTIAVCRPCCEPDISSRARFHAAPTCAEDRCGKASRRGTTSKTGQIGPHPIGAAMGKQPEMSGSIDFYQTNHFPDLHHSPGISGCARGYLSPNLRKIRPPHAAPTRFRCRPARPQPYSNGQAWTALRQFARRGWHR